MALFQLGPAALPAFAPPAAPAPPPPEPQTSPRDRLERRLAAKTATVGIVGLGYVGLPLAAAFVDAGFGVLGYDVDQEKIDKLRRGESYIGHLSAARLQSWTAAERFAATADAARLAAADAILICVPTPLTETREPDLGYVTATARTIAGILRPGQLVVLESTTYPGTTRDVVLPILAESGLAVGRDFFLAYSPEREDPGNPQHTAATIPKVVGGYDAASARLAEALYRPAVARVVPVSSCEAAEACKILENTYRAVNIALVNELKVLCERMGVDVWEVIDAAQTKPFGFQAFYPGPGLGGHCIPIDPFYLAWVARKHGMATRFIELAGEINSAMPEHVLRRVGDALNDAGKPVRGSRVAVLGAAYKRDVDDPRESPTFVLIEGLLARGAVVTYNDPHIPRLPRMRAHPTLPEMASQPLTADYLSAQDCVLLATNHSGYDYGFIAAHAALVVDTRNAFAGVRGPARIVKA
jgi:UDP-N-acetyl-D-glucosamine dehydrogenase